MQRQSSREGRARGDVGLPLGRRAGLTGRRERKASVLKIKAAFLTKAGFR